MNADYVVSPAASAIQWVLDVQSMQLDGYVNPLVNKGCDSLVEMEWHRGKEGSRWILTVYLETSGCLNAGLSGPDGGFEELDVSVASSFRRAWDLFMGREPS